MRHAQATLHSGPRADALFTATEVISPRTGLRNREVEYISQNTKVSKKRNQKQFHGCPEDREGSYVSYEPLSSRSGPIGINPVGPLNLNWQMEFGVCVNLDGKNNTSLLLLSFNSAVLKPCESPRLFSGVTKVETNNTQMCLFFSFSKGYLTCDIIALYALVVLCFKNVSVLFIFYFKNYFKS